MLLYMFHGLTLTLNQQVEKPYAPINDAANEQVCHTGHERLLTLTMYVYYGVDFYSQSETIEVAIRT